MEIARNEHTERDRERGSPRDTLPAERLEQIRERIRERAYDNAPVREATARGILGSRDV